MMQQRAVANKLKTENKIAIVSALCGEDGISGIGRMTGTLGHDHQAWRSDG